MSEAGESRQEVILDPQGDYRKLERSLLTQTRHSEFAHMFHLLDLV